MSRQISASLRLQVAERAQFRCEYCRLPQSCYYHEFQIDHIRSIKHLGLTHFDNLAYCCPDCNKYKGSDVGTHLDKSLAITRFFNPRIDNWFEHFEVFEGAIYSKTDIGEATIRILQINIPDRIIIRQELMKDGFYP
jgi:hypothetical protein